jgi:sugar phosphate isomerase/epimerase
MISLLVRWICLSLLLTVVIELTAAGSPEAVRARPFFVFDNGLRGIESVEEQAQLLKKLGFDGICTRPANASDELSAAFDEVGLGLLASYVVLPAGSELPAPVVRHVRSLKGGKCMIWLALTRTEASDMEAAETIREVFDLAEENGLETVLYPHAGFHTSTVRRCEDLRQLARRPGLGLGFSLCHFLRQNDEAELEKTIRSAAEHLKLVQINGASPGPGANWDRLIQPLGSGNFEIGRVIRVLDEIGYEGPVNLQCYNIKQDPRQHLKQSIQAWRDLNAASAKHE